MNIGEIQLQQHLKSHRYSLTSARKVVFAALQDAEPQTMAALVKACAELDRATVYRTIELFEQLGIVQKLHIGWKYRIELTDTFMHHHHHMTCTHCGRIIPLPEDDELESRLWELATLRNFEPQDHQIEISGLCQACQKLSTV